MAGNVAIARPAVCLSNASSDPLSIWIEPWCDELSLAPRSVLEIVVTPPAGHDAAPPTIELRDDMLVIWAAAAGTMTVAIADVFQDTASHTIDLSPDLFELPVKDFVGVVFGNYPQARPGGAPAPPKRSFWRWLLRRWRYGADAL